MESRSAILFWVAAAAAFAAASAATIWCRRRKLHAAEPLAAFSYLLLPTTAVLVSGIWFQGLAPEGSWARVLKTFLGIEIIWITLSLLKAVFLWRGAALARIPVLFLDVVRLTLVLLGSAFVIAGVWNKDLSHFLTTLGIGSIVLGLALQDTLGNFFSGIALFFERPFRVGDWVRVGDREGEVIEANWRSVHLRDRQEVMVVIPNSVLGRERIENFSRPTPVCGVTARVGFSYDDPPNVVKDVLQEVLRGSPGVLKEPRPRVRTKDFADSSVTYEIKYFIDRFDRLPDIEEEIKTRVWYAARRRGLRIPFPTRTIYKTETPAEVKAAVDLTETLRAVPLFEPLQPSEFEALARTVSAVHYGHGERVVEQGAQGDCMYVVRGGHAVVSIAADGQHEHVVYRLAAGDFFGEMSLLAGEARAATVTAEGDLELIVVHKDSLTRLFVDRPGLLQRLAEVAATRRSGLEVVRTRVSDTAPQRAGREGAGALVARIRSFFGIAATVS